MTSVSESPRRGLAADSPMTQRIASMMFDLPQPFGPTTPVMLVGRCRVVGSTKDLKPDSLIVDSRILLIHKAKAGVYQPRCGRRPEPSCRAFPGAFVPVGPLPH